MPDVAVVAKHVVVAVVPFAVAAVPVLVVSPAEEAFVVVVVVAVVVSSAALLAKCVLPFSSSTVSSAWP